MPTCHFRRRARGHTDSDLAPSTLEGFRQSIVIEGGRAVAEGSDVVVLGHYEEGVGAFNDLGASGGGTRATVFTGKIGVIPVVLVVACYSGETAG